jgi:hypothetical protein
MESRAAANGFECAELESAAGATGIAHLRAADHRRVQRDLDLVQHPATGEAPAARVAEVPVVGARAFLGSRIAGLGVVNGARLPAMMQADMWPSAV